MATDQSSLEVPNSFRVALYIYTFNLTSGKIILSSKNLIFLKIFLNLPNILNMVINGGEFFTVAEMAEMLGISPAAVKERLNTAGEKPFVKNALYRPESLEAIRNVPGKGRPKKEK